MHFRFNTSLSPKTAKSCNTSTNLLSLKLHAVDCVVKTVCGCKKLGGPKLSDQNIIRNHRKSVTLAESLTRNVDGRKRQHSNAYHSLYNHHKNSLLCRNSASSKRNIKRYCSITRCWSYGGLPDSRVLLKMFPAPSLKVRRPMGIGSAGLTMVQVAHLHQASGLEAS